MAQSINRRPLLAAATSDDSDMEDGIETEIDDASISVPDQKPFFKAQPRDRFV